MTTKPYISKSKKSKGAVSLWDLMTFMSGCVAFGNSFAAATNAEFENFSLLTPLIIGIVVGIACIWVIRSIGHLIGPRIDLDIEYEDLDVRVKIRLSVIYFLAFIWLIISGLLSYQITKFFIEI